MQFLNVVEARIKKNCADHRVLQEFAQSDFSESLTVALKYKLCTEH